MPHRRIPRRYTLAGAWPALVMAFALLIQGLVPGAAMAHEMNQGRTVVLCTSAGEKTVTLPNDASHKGFAGFKCADCVMASIASVLPPAPAAAPVRYIQIVRAERSRPPLRLAAARPRLLPPSHAPPETFDL
jgi:hypothetical protein